MGYDAHVYSPNDQIVDRAQVVEKMREKGWDILFITDWDTMSVASSGAVSEETVLGWRSDPELADEMQTIVEHHDKVGIDELFENRSIFSVELYLSKCRSKEDIEEMFDPSEARADYLEAMRNARTAYWLTIPLGASQASYELMEALWYALGDISEGLLEDQQLGYLFFSTEEPPTPVPSQSRPSLLVTLLKYIIAFAAVVILLWFFRR